MQFVLRMRVWDGNYSSMEKIRMECEAEKLLSDALKTIRQRGKQYGSIAPLLNQVAERWSLTLKADVTAAQVALCMIDMKIARVNNGSTDRDNAMDIAGYAALLSEMQINPQAKGVENG